MPEHELERRRQYMDNIWKSFTYQRPPVVRELKGRENEGDGSCTGSRVM
jgi:hypothetical protein